MGVLHLFGRVLRAFRWCGDAVALIEREGSAKSGFDQLVKHEDKRA